MFGIALRCNDAEGIAATYPAVLDEAVFWIDSAYSVAGEQTADNRGTGGAALDAMYGSTAGADTNDPVLLTHAGENYVYIPGTSTIGNQLSGAFDAAYNAIAGDLDIIVRASSDLWSLNNSQWLVSRWITGNPEVFILSAGVAQSFVLEWSADGVTSTSLSVTPSTPLVDGTTYWLRFTFDVDNGAGGRTLRMYLEPDADTPPTSWTEVGSATSAGVTSLFTGSTTPMVMGSLDASSFGQWLGKYHYCEVRNGIDGPAVFIFDAAADIIDAGALTLTATSGQTVTVGRAVTGRKTAIVTRPVWLLGTDDYLQVSDNALIDFSSSESFSLMVVGRPFATQSNFLRWISKETGVSNIAGYAITNWVGAQGNAYVGDGTTNATDIGAGVTLGAPVCFVAVVDRVAQLIEIFTNGTGTGSPTSTAAVGSPTNATALRVGANGAGGQFLDAEVMAAGVWRRVLTGAEILAINDYYGTV